MSAHEYVREDAIALLYYRLGDIDRSIEWWRRGVESNGALVIDLAKDAEFARCERIPACRRCWQSGESSSLRSPSSPEEPTRDLLQPVVARRFGLGADLLDEPAQSRLAQRYPVARSASCVSLTRAASSSARARGAIEVRIVARRQRVVAAGHLPFRVVPEKGPRHECSLSRGTRGTHPSGETVRPEHRRSLRIGTERRPRRRLRELPPDLVLLDAERREPACLGHLPEAGVHRADAVCSTKLFVARSSNSVRMPRTASRSPRRA